MLTLARQKTAEQTRHIPYVEADAMCLSFGDESFDAVTIAFGLRNLAQFCERSERALHRVIKPGGRLVVLECSHPIVPGLQAVFDFLLPRILPRIGGMISGSRIAYEYLPDSVSAGFLISKALASLMEQSGFSAVKYQNLTGGIAALHSGTKTV